MSLCFQFIFSQLLTLWLAAKSSQCIVDIQDTQHQVICHIQHLHYRHTSSRPAFKRLCVCLFIFPKGWKGLLFCINWV